MKKISVVIPCYNASEYLDRCMEHILKQTIGFENIEIILVDDASTDGGATLSLMMEYEKRYPDNIIVIPLEQNMRQGGARNVGIMYAGGEYLLFCDADDWLMLDAMEILYRMASKYDADVVEFQFKEVAETERMEAAETDGEIEYVIWEFGEDDENRKKFMISSASNYTLGAINKLYRLHMIQNHNIRFAEHLICEEPSFTMLTRVYERKHMIVNTALYCYFQSPNSTTRGRWDDRKFDNLKVWMSIVEDFKERGLFEKYHDELEYMFYSWGFGVSIRILTVKGYMISEEELRLFQKISLQLFPKMCQNSYIIEDTDIWSLFMQKLLKMEIAKENILELNELLRIYLNKWAEQMNSKS